MFGRYNDRELREELDILRTKIRFLENAHDRNCDRLHRLEQLTALLGYEYRDTRTQGWVQKTLDATKKSR